MATIVPLAVEVKARVTNFNSGIQSAARNVQDLTKSINNVADSIIVFEDVVKKSAITIATDFVQNIRLAIEQVQTLAEQVELLAQRVLVLTSNMLNFTANFFPALSATAMGFRVVAASLSFVIRTGLMILALTALTMWFRGLTFHAAMTSVTIGMLTNNILLLASRLIFLSGIPLLAAMAITVEVMNRKTAKLNGTLTPLQHGLEAIRDAWEKWSLLMSSGIMDMVGALLWTIGKALSTIATTINIANEYWGTNFVLIYRTLKILTSMAIVLSAIYGTYIALRGNVIILAFIAGITRLIGLLQVVATMTGLNIALTIVWTRAQMFLNTVILSNPFLVAFLVLLAIAGLIYGIVKAFQYFRQSSVEAQEAAQRAVEKTEMLKNVTEKYKNSLRETVDEHKKMLDVMNKIQEAAKTPVEKASDRAAELQKAINEPKQLQEKINALTAEIETKKKLIANTTDKGTIESLKERNEEAIQTLKKLQDIQAKIPTLTQAQIANQQALNRKEFAQDAGLDISEKLSNYDTLMKQMDTIKEVIKRNDQANEMTVKETQNAIDNAVKNFRQAEGVEKMVEPFKTASDILNETNNKLKLWSSDGIINAQEFSNATKRAADAFAQATGIKKYFEKVETLQDVCSNMAIYAQQMNLSQEDLIAAQDKAKAAFEKQAESYSLYQKAQDALLSTEEKVTKAMNMIDADALKFGWSEEITDKMKQIAEAEIMGKKGKQKDNQVIVRGSTAYTDYQNKNLGNDHLKTIRDNSKKQVDFAQKTVEAIKETGEVFKKCFEVIG
ncbi:MAG: hypothetical protein LBL13_03055 [Bacteroidales bacterium]|jgi:hypothetical protein|nr:hypothetical protein [Bacteroidales bacterium]